MAVNLVARGVAGGAAQALAYGPGLRGIDEDVHQCGTPMAEALIVRTEAGDGPLRTIRLMFGGIPVDVVGEELDRRLHLTPTGRSPLAKRLHAEFGGFAPRPIQKLADLGNDLWRLLRRKPDGGAHTRVIEEEGGATSVTAVPNVDAVNQARSVAHERSWPRLVIFAVVIAVAAIVDIVVTTAAVPTVREGGFERIDQFWPVKHARSTRAPEASARKDGPETLFDGAHRLGKGAHRRVGHVIVCDGGEARGEDLLRLRRLCKLSYRPQKRRGLFVTRGHPTRRAGSPPRAIVGLVSRPTLAEASKPSLNAVGGTPRIGDIVVPVATFAHLVRARGGV